MKILAIGNSFSQDATAYLHDLAEAGGAESKIVNLFIPGCSLETHWENVLSGGAAYCRECNGRDTGEMVSLRDSLAEEAWDVVTLQQASHFSGQPETYEPYLAQLVGFVKALAPHAGIYLHETWAYETDSDHGAFPLYHRNQNEMYIRLKDAYSQAAADLGLPLIPSGDVIQALRGTPAFCYAKGGLSLCRDGFHMGWTYGRYAVAAAWYETLFGKDIRCNPFVPCDPQGPAAEEELLTVIRQTVHTFVGGRQDAGETVRI
ncbi:MAG TPA: DUF4886 domain-containing protein [Firmicutes bacterium]|nr:DUF4886 domain-containing protein [Bacillota bacterium]